MYNVLSSHLTHPSELAARSHSDQFLLLLKFQDENTFSERIHTIIDDLRGQKTALGIRHKQGFSIGIYVITDKMQAPHILIGRADLAKNICKSSNDQKPMFYSEVAANQLRLESDIINALDISLERGDFQIHLQPKVDLKTGTVAGAEALIRWNHPALGFLSPAVFLPILEKKRSITKLDLFVFEEVCKTLARWEKEGRELMPVAVNISRVNLQNEQFLDCYLEVLRKHALAPQWLELELTESIFIKNWESAICTFSRIRACGIRCAIDDFGIGYSSLGLLRNLPIDTLKLDRSFFINPSIDDKSRILIQSITQLVSKLGITCVAEGVESYEMVDFLSSTSCDMIQGYFYSKPLPIAEFEQFAFTEKGRLRALPTHSGRSSVSA